MGRERSRVAAGSCFFGPVRRSTGRGAPVGGRGLHGSYSKERSFGGHLLFSVQVGGVQTALTHTWSPRKLLRLVMPSAGSLSLQELKTGGRGLELDFEDGSGEGNTTAS